MKAWTVQQPWADAIAVGAKTTENRGGGLARYRGPVAIHSGLRWSVRGAHDLAVREALGLPQHRLPERAEHPTGVVVAVAQLVDAHRAEPGCCDDPWAMAIYNGKPVRCHYVLAAAVRLPTPVRVLGRLGLWDVPDDVADAVRAQLEEAARDAA